MALDPFQQEIGEAFGYEPFEDDELSQQFYIEPDFQDAPTGAIPCTGNVYKNKKGKLRIYWIPAGDNYSAEEKDSLQGWYDIPTNEDIQDWTFDSTCPTPCGDDVEPDHVDSWLRILGLI
jgi:hypothetical protein